MKWCICFFVVLFTISAVSLNTNDSLRDPFHRKNLIKQYTFYSFDYKNISIRELLQQLAEMGGWSIIIGESVKGNVTVRLNNIRLWDALNVVIKMSGLIKKEQNNIIFISSNEESVPSERSFKLHHVDVTDVVNLIKNQTGLLSKSGQVIVDTRNNVLWVKDLPEKMETLSTFVRNSDVPDHQILIEARIVNIDDDYMNELGVQFGTIQPQSKTFNIVVAKFNNKTWLDVELAALEQAGHAHIVACPHLLTVSKKLAMIESGQEIPYQEKTNSGGTSIAFKKAALRLKVTPQWLPNHYINLQLDLDQNKVSSMMIEGMPSIQTQSLNTEVLVKDGQTVVLGGIFEQTKTSSYERLPFLGALPGIGHLLGRQLANNSHRSILIFVTPSNVDNDVKAKQNRGNSQEKYYFNRAYDSR